MRVGRPVDLLASHRRVLFPDEMSAGLFASGRGRTSVPADVMATVITLQVIAAIRPFPCPPRAGRPTNQRHACHYPGAAVIHHEVDGVAQPQSRTFGAMHTTGGDA
jgi:hypothetical protein